jgi:hypothetical protein
MDPPQSMEAGHSGHTGRTAVGRVEGGSLGEKDSAINPCEYNKLGSLSFIFYICI